MPLLSQQTTKERQGAEIAELLTPVLSCGVASSKVQEIVYSLMVSRRQKRFIPVLFFFSIPLSLILGLHLCSGAIMKAEQNAATSHKVNPEVTCPANTNSSPSITSKERKDEATTKRSLDTSNHDTPMNFAQAIPRGGGLMRENFNVVMSTVSSLVTTVIEWVGESSFRSWLVLMCVILADTTATGLMKVASDQESALHFALAMILFAMGPLGLGLCLKQIDVSIAYATWSALGTATMSVFGIIFWNEEYDVKKILCLTLIVSGVVGLQLMDKGK